MTCTGDSLSEFGTWGPCEDEQLPATELCDANAEDENCDGAGNEGCSCVDGQSQQCGNGVGACVAGTQECSGGALGPCTGALGPITETCNDADDDCDGTIDEGLVVSCGSSVGACQPGTSTCMAGVWGSCEGATTPGTETCNSIDDDCDNDVDEDTDLVCGSDVGACAAGVVACTMGTYDACVGETGPGVESCNNVDDDCDGDTDEMLQQTCGIDEGICQSGTETCVSGVWGSCFGSIDPGTETCNTFDDDCDGDTDEGCNCVNGTQQQCGTNVGQCEFGTQTCVNGDWDSCSGGIGPTTELCNGLNDDCDADIDEDTCTVPPIANCPGNITTATPLQTVILSGGGSDPDGGSVSCAWSVTSAPLGSTSTPSSPTSCSTAFFLDLAGTYTLTLTVTDDEGDTASCNMTITATPNNDLHVELVWDTPYGDVDLHLIQANIDPATAWFYTEPDCFWGNTTGAWPPNGGAGNSTLAIDDIDGYGPEDINIDNSPENGIYTIGVAYYCSHSLQAPGAPPINTGDGPTTATVKIFCGGSLIATYSNIDLDKTGRFVEVATVSWPTCAGVSLYNETWTALVQPAVVSAPIHCDLPCNNDNDCGGGEVCVSSVCVLE